MVKKIILYLVAITLFAAAGYFYFDSKKVGREIDSYKGVPVHYNGANYTKSYGKNYSKDGYYYGQKWQCVEYIKRFYYEAKGHRMPDVMGNARDFFDPSLEQGVLNKKRGLVQFKNGGDERPQADDLLVFNDTKYGHVAIITKVSDKELEVIQQNIYGKPRDRYKISFKNGQYTIGDKRKPAGWLRLAK